MKTLLIFPPVADPVHPPLGIAKLAAYLRKKNKTVKTIDLNIACYDYFFNKDLLKYFYNKVSDRINDLEQKTSLTKEEIDEYRCLSVSYLDGQYLIDNAEEALRDLRLPYTYNDWTKYSDLASVINRTMKLVADSHYPAIWNPRNALFSSSQTSTRGVLSNIRNQKENFFIPFFNKYINEIKNYAPDNIGISINFFCQLVPGMTLASILKEEIKDVKIILGGAFFSSYRNNWQVLAPFRKITDIIIPFAGEIPLLNTISALENNQSLNNVPGIINCQNDIFTYIQNDESDPDLDIILPDFSDFSFAKYLSPYSIIPYSATKGCYWGKCTFCSQHLLYEFNSFKKKKDEIIFKELSELSNQYGVTEFYFVDEAIPVKTAMFLSKMLSNTNRKISWFGDMRLEAGINTDLLNKLEIGGCRMLIMGLESSVSRIIDLMKKGTSPNIISKILKSCSESNIKTFVMFFIGFPTESEEEALQTVQFVEDHKDGINYVSFDRFVLLKNTPVYNDPSYYSITVKNDEKSEDLAIHARYKVSQGLSSKDADILLDKIKNRPEISQYLKYNLISRNHLPFLPKLKTTSTNLAIKNIPFDYYPKIKKNVILTQFKYDIRKDAPLKITDTLDYCYNPATSSLIEFSKYEKTLMEFCDGNHSFKEILDYLGNKNRENINQFYNHLYNEGMI